MITKVAGVAKVRPISDYVLVQPSTREGETPSGLIIPDKAQKRPQEGEVVAVGPGVMLKDGTRRPPQVNVGDRVFFTSWSGEEHKNQILMREGDILAVVEGGDS